MPIDDATEATVRALWEAGARHGRPPAPVPEADPWEDDAPGSERAPLVVVLPGTPDVEVRLHRDGADEVQVESAAYLEVPRRDTVAVVDALLAGRAVRRPRVRGVLGNLLAVFLDSPAPSDLEVRVAGDDAPRTYRAQVTATQPISTWIMSRPVADD